MIKAADDIIAFEKDVVIVIYSIIDKLLQDCKLLQV